VTIALPTFNRAHGLERALASALGQTEADLEVLISDNASEDETADVARAAVQSDTRVRYVRQERNLGLTANFNAVLRAAHGRYVMVLADDDWIEADYVATCRAALDGDSRLALASGRAIYHSADGSTFAGKELQVVDASPPRRARAYLGGVTDNVSIYGLMRRPMVALALPMRNCLAGDWLLIARMVFQGALRTLPGTALHRSTSGTSVDFQRTVERMGLSAFEARRPTLAMASFVYRDIARDSPVYAGLGPARRQALGATCAAAVAASHPFELVQDELEPLLSRPGLEQLDGLLRAISRRLRR